MSDPVRLGNRAALVIAALLGAATGYGAWMLWMQPAPEPEIPRLTLMPSTPPPAATELLGEVAPAFTLANAQGEQRRLADWRGKVVLLNFWASWCAPCREEMPMLERLYQEMTPSGFVVLGVTSDKPDEITEFLGQIGVTFPILHGDAGALKLAQSYGNALGALPYSALIDRDGHIRYLKTGLLEEADLRAAIAPHL